MMAMIMIMPMKILALILMLVSNKNVITTYLYDRVTKTM